MLFRQSVKFAEDWWTMFAFKTEHSYLFTTIFAFLNFLFLALLLASLVFQVFDNYQRLLTLFLRLSEEDFVDWERLLFNLHLNKFDLIFLRSWLLHFWSGSLEVLEAFWTHVFEGRMSIHIFALQTKFGESTFIWTLGHNGNFSGPTVNNYYITNTLYPNLYEKYLYPRSNYKEFKLCFPIIKKTFEAS